MADVFLIAVPTYANLNDVRLFDPTTAPDIPGGEVTTPFLTLMGAGS